jgi:hypothetical protein
MERPSITDQQVEVLQQRFASVGIGRRTFLQVADRSRGHGRRWLQREARVRGPEAGAR